MPTKQPPPDRNDFPGGLSGGEHQLPDDHRVGETTRHNPKVDQVDPAPSQPAKPEDGDKPSRRP